jgi:hypothetical protein
MSDAENNESNYRPQRLNLVFPLGVKPASSLSR